MSPQTLWYYAGRYNSALIGQLMYLSRTRGEYDQSRGIDAANRARNVDMIKNHAGAYSDEENKIIHEGLLELALFKTKKSKKAKALSKTVKNSIVFKDGESLGVGRSEAIVRASKEQVLSYMLDFGARCRWDDSDVERSVLWTINDHHYICYVRKKGIYVGGLKIRPREGMNAVLWRQEDDKTLFLVAVTAEHELRPINSAERVRIKMPLSMLISEITPCVCRVVYINQLDMGANLPAWIVNFSMLRFLSLTYKMQNYFQELRGMEEYTAEDGKAVGEIMVAKTKAEKTGRHKGETKVAARVRELFKMHNGLREIGIKYEFLQAMMVKVLENKLRPAGDVETKLCNVSVKQGRTIGAGLAVSLASNLTAEAAVDEWIGRCPALREMDRTEVWFRPMMDIVARRLLGEVSWGLKMRVFVGAALSMLDMASDINVIVLYWSTPDEKAYAIILLGMLAACMGLQMLMVSAQNKTKPLRLLKEILIVCSGLKPVVDAARVSGGAEYEEGHVVDPKTELVFIKCTELFAESIPGEDCAF
jgi:hypothetical protein